MIAPSLEEEAQAALDAADSAQSIKPDDAGEIARLAKLLPMDYDRERKAAAEALGIRPATLDVAVKEARRKPDNASGSGLPFDEIEPWPSPVDAAQAMAEAHGLLARFVVADLATIHAATVWAALTWFADDATVLPLALITAPEKGCGKTVLLAAMGRLSRRALSTSNISPAALFRAVDAWHPTLLIDEADTFVRENEELRGLLNSGHTRDTAHVIRAVEVNGEFEPRSFSTWGAKAIAGIGRLPETIESRSVILKMRRALPGERTENLRHVGRGPFVPVQRKFARWAEDAGRRFANLHPTMPELSNRDADNWEPLLALADLAGGEWPQRIRNAARTLTARNDAQTANEELLGDIKAAFAKKARDRLPTVELLDALAADTEAPWATWNRGKPITARQLSKRLSEFGISPGTFRAGSTTAKGYRLDQFTDAFGRYLPDPAAESVTRSQVNGGAGFSDSTSVTHADRVTDEKAGKASNGAGCDRVTDGAGSERAEFEAVPDDDPALTRILAKFKEGFGHDE